MMSHPTRSRVTGALLLIGALLLLGACAAGPNELVDTGPDPAGFWLGLWQGLISPITFIVSLFTSSVNIYEVQNNGNWYDFGFMLGVACASAAAVGQALQERGVSGSAAATRQLQQKCWSSDHFEPSGAHPHRLSLCSSRESVRYTEFSSNPVRRRVNLAAVAPIA